MSELLKAALKYAEAGRKVFPVKLDKSPFTEHGYLEASTDEATIRQWWGRWPGAGIGTPTGPDWFVLDVDGAPSLQALEVEHGPLPPTREVITPRPGRHLYLRGSGTTTSNGDLPKDIHCRGAGGYVLLPPSPHKNGGTYEWRNDDLEIAKAPAWLLKLLGAGKHTNGRAPEVEGDIPEQQRNTTLTSMAGTMRRRGFSEAGIDAALQVENLTRCKPPLDKSDVRKIARSIARYKPVAETVATLETLTELLGLQQVGKRIDHVRVFGRGSRAHVYLRLDDGNQIVLDPLGAACTPPKLAIELASQAGATPTFKPVDVTRAVAMIYDLGDHHAAAEIGDRAFELGAAYLRDAAEGSFQNSDQAARWKAFEGLRAHERHRTPTSSDIVLTDSTTGIRYVRAQWFAEYLRRITAPG